MEFKPSHKYPLSIFKQTSSPVKFGVFNWVPFSSILDKYINKFENTATKIKPNYIVDIGHLKLTLSADYHAKFPDCTFHISNTVLDKTPFNGCVGFNMHEQVIVNDKYISLLYPCFDRRACFLFIEGKKISVFDFCESFYCLSSTPFDS